jgi:UDP:flavonoid glycosyltransferase YjiC (YdhE family)
VVSLHTYPSRTNSVYAPPSSLPHSWPTPGVVNRVAWQAAERLRTLVFRKYLNNLRAKVGLPSTWSSTETLMARRGIPELQMYDAALVPGLAEEWGEQRPFVGFLWFGREEREAIGELAEQHSEVLEWADAGVPPIFFGFGSMPILDFAPVIELIARSATGPGSGR